MSDSIIRGIDPGAHGAIAPLDEAGNLQEVVDTPSTQEAPRPASSPGPGYTGRRAVADADPIEAAIALGAARAIRRRAARQRKIAKIWTAHGEHGAVVVTGEGRIAERIAAALEAAADELEGGGSQ
jgi:hypothetical protein